jgi:prenyltransferase beta subunit
VLAKIPSLRLDYEISCLHLATLLANKNRWTSYWWTSDIYATAFAMQALSHHPDFKSICEAPALWLIGEQHSSGYWPNPTTNESNAFYTALAIKSLITYDATSFQDSISKGVEWLLAHQTEDGSWQTNRILRIPATDVMDPSTITHWRKSSFGVNCYVDDHNRVFTTSTVLNALHHYSITSCF